MAYRAFFVLTRRDGQAAATAILGPMDAYYPEVVDPLTPEKEPLFYWMRIQVKQADAKMIDALRDHPHIKVIRAPLAHGPVDPSLDWHPIVELEKRAEGRLFKTTAEGERPERTRRQREQDS